MPCSMSRTAALTAVLLTACGTHGATDRADGSRPSADGSYEAGEGSGDRGDAAADSGGVGDVATPLDDGPAPDRPGTQCANQSVPPSTLECTGLYADIASKTLAPGVQFYQPAVPLWSDNAQKMRWIQLPPGTQIDASNPNEWLFPVGTKVWKEFSKDGKRIETRLFQKLDRGPPPYWVHATYAWNADESIAVTSGGGNIALDSDGGIYHIPTFDECDKCHKGRTDRILGFEQVSLGLQGAQGLTLAELVRVGIIAPLPQQVQLSIGDDGTGAAAPALAWIHVNCGVSCHNGNSNASAYGAGMRVRLDPTLLDGRPPTAADFDSLTTTLGAAATTPAWIQPIHWNRIVPGDSRHSLLVQLIANRGKNNPVGGQMPPIASAIVDNDDVANVVAWIDKMPSTAGMDAGSDGGVDAAMGTSADAAADASVADAGAD
jgi:hypothetical protein